MDDAQKTALLTFLKPLIERQRAVAEQRIKEERVKWLLSQPWYRDLAREAYFGSGALEHAMDYSQPTLIDFYGHGGKESGLTEYSGGVGMTLPLDKSQSVRFTAGGSGASGTIKTPIGDRHLGEFFPEVGLSYRRTW